MLKEGMFVKGLYYGVEYTGTIRKIRSYYGNDNNLHDYLIYYVNTDQTMNKGTVIESNNICIDGMQQLSKKSTIGKWS